MNLEASRDSWDKLYSLQETPLTSIVTDARSRQGDPKSDASRQQSAEHLAIHKPPRGIVPPLLEPRPLDRTIGSAVIELSTNLAKCSLERALPGDSLRVHGWAIGRQWAGAVPGEINSNLIWGSKHLWEDNPGVTVTEICVSGWWTQYRHESYML